MDSRFSASKLKHGSVFDRLYCDSEMRSQNYALLQRGRGTKPAVTSRPRKIEEELLKKHAESEARKKHLRDQHEAQQLQELRSAPEINQNSKLLVSHKQSDLVVKKKRPIPSFKSSPSVPRLHISVDNSRTELQETGLVTGRSNIPGRNQDSLIEQQSREKASLRVPVSTMNSPKPLTLTEDLRKKFSELLVPNEDEPVMRPEQQQVIKRYQEKEAQSDPKISLTAFSSPISKEAVESLMSDRTASRKLFYMNSYDRNRYWSRIREEKLNKQREIKEELELEECTFNPVKREPSQRDNRSTISLPRSQSLSRISSYTERFKLRKAWKSRATSPQIQT